MECRKTKEQTAYPIFYDVEPTNVRSQSGAVGKAFAKQEYEEILGWNRLVPIKVNILGWRIYHNWMPLRTNLVNKGIDVPSVLCPFCLNSEESSDHVFGACGVAARVWNNICKWLDLPLILDFSVLGILIWLDTLSVNSKKQKLIHGIILSAWWIIWWARNEVVFQPEVSRKDLIFDSLRIYSFSWITNRDGKNTISWTEWLKNPLLVM
ncbi:disease resistance protein RPV1-like [Bidens hawaiensis]|uniref:disease resistance protein RPV1-like n=1 Tax=Bidens hawaiensis TaxID=980011 RepID=UPI00404A254A